MAAASYGVWMAHAGRLFALLLAVTILSSLPAAARTLRIVAFGDSLSAGYGLARNDAFPAKLEAALKAKGYDVTVINAGVSGDTSSAGLVRLDWSIPKDADAVIVELGANDMLRGMPPAAVEQNLDLILAELKRRQIRVLVVGMKAAPNLGADYARAFDSLYPRLARTYGDRFYPFFLDGVAGKPALIQADGKHPNAQGVDIIVGRMLPAVRAALR